MAKWLSETRFNGRGQEVGMVRSLDYAVAIEDHDVCSHAASCQKLVREQILAILAWTTLDRAINTTIVFIECMRLLNIT